MGVEHLSRKNQVERSKRRKTNKGIPYGHKMCTRKKRYDSEIEAQLAVTRRDDARYYQCPLCNGWHLSRRANGFG